MGQGKYAGRVTGRRDTCAQKTGTGNRYPTHAIAAKVARRMRRKHGDATVQPYRCRVCGWWHVGGWH